MNVIRAAAAILLVGVLAPAITTAAEQPTAEQAERDKIICRKTLEVGSLVKKKKECYTKAQWEEIADAHQRGARKTQKGLAGGSNCQAPGSC